MRKLSGRVVFARAVRDIRDAYAAGDLFVVPTLYDGFGLAALEAMSCGLPVIVSRAAGISDLLTDTVDSLVSRDHTGPTEVAGAIAAIRESETLRKTMGLEARATAEQYSWSAIGGRIVQIYEEVAA